MKRSFLTSALVLALAVPVAACGGSTPGDGPKDPSDPAAADKGAESTGDPVADLQALSDGIQKDVDALFQPIKDADAVIDSLGKITADLKAAKSKTDGKKVMAEVAKVVGGGEATLDKLDDAAKPIVTERIEKLKALLQSLKDSDQKAKDLVQRITDGVPKVAASVAKALPKLEAKIKAPFGVSAEDKKKAEEDKKKLTDIVDGFKAKAADWQKMITDLPAKVKEIPAKLAKLK
jgi:DNA repair exonuclease SbcCD ATPase subunit/predicted small lipoprotein YifL